MPFSTHLLNHQKRYGFAMLCLYILINNTINATNVIMEAHRDGKLGFALWEPFVWEYTSAFSTLTLVPFIWMLLDKVPFNWQKILQSIFRYWLASLFFCAAHVGLMVALRKCLYWYYGRSYDFGLFWYEMLYEYRKDLWGFIFLIALIHGFRYVVSQLSGEARLCDELAPTPSAEDSNLVPTLERVIVRKLGKEYIVKIEDVDWLESSGNYVNLHSQARVYPLRATLSQLTRQIEKKGFRRIHRSYTVKLDAIDSITQLPSGDAEITLKTGQTLSMSRRYKTNFKEFIHT
ncbi:LytTr DNA-binding response regulator [Pseudoalteromonas luteoviolacea B = ATCC 29581]|nr:LytTr DNA-binding response regulator [Pseudoalteromonas luteoviolacea B = ATCC 29581]